MERGSLPSRVGAGRPGKCRMCQCHLWQWRPPCHTTHQRTDIACAPSPHAHDTDPRKAQGECWTSPYMPDSILKGLESALCFFFNFITRRHRRYFPKQVDHRAIAGGGQLNGTLYRPRIDVGPSHLVEHFEPRIDLRMLLCAAPLDLHAQATHLLAFFAQDRDDIHRCAACHCQQEEAVRLGANTHSTNTLLSIEVNAILANDSSEVHTIHE